MGCCVTFGKYLVNWRSRPTIDQSSGAESDDTCVDGLRKRRATGSGKNQQCTHAMYPSSPSTTPYTAMWRRVNHFRPRPTSAHRGRVTV